MATGENSAWTNVSQSFQRAIFDRNRDGKIDEADLLLTVDEVQQVSSKIGDFAKKSIDGAELAVFDLNSDGTVDKSDLKMALDEAQIMSDEIGDAAKKSISTIETVSLPPLTKQFGEFSQQFIGDAERALEGWNEEAWGLLEKVFGKQTRTIRETCVVLLLSYGQICTLTTAFLFTVAWIAFALQHRVSPFTPGQWTAFLTMHSTLRLVADPLLFPIRAAAAVVTTPHYLKLVNSLQEIIGPRERPALRKLNALLLAFFLGNFVVPSFLVGFGIWVGGFVTGVRVRPVVM